MFFLPPVQPYIDITKSVLNKNISTTLRTYRIDFISKLQRGKFTENLICMDGLSDYFSPLNLDDRGPYVNYKDQPDLVVQIKHVMNALYLFELVFVEIEKHKHTLKTTNALTTLGTVLSYGAGETVYKASQLVAHLDFGFLRALCPEQQMIFNFLEMMKVYRKNHTPHFIDGISNQMGLAAGHVLNNMQPDSKKIDYSVLTHFSGILPGYIQDATRFIKRYANEIKPHELTLNKPGIQELEKNAIELLQSINVTQNNRFSGVFNTVHYVRIVRRIITLSTSTLNQIGHLNAATQTTICDNMSKIKIESVKLLALADKLENAFLLKPGTLSTPVHNKIKEYYETILFYVENTAVLGPASTINDRAYIQLRLDEAKVRDREANSRLFKAMWVKRAFEAFFNLTQDESGKNDKLVCVDESIKKQLIEHYLLMQPYVKAFDVVLDRDIINDLMRPTRFLEGYRGSTTLSGLNAKKIDLMKCIQREIVSQDTTIVNNDMIVAHIQHNSGTEILQCPESMTPSNAHTFHEHDALEAYPLPQFEINLVDDAKTFIQYALSERTLTIRKMGHSFIYSFRPCPEEIQEGEIHEEDLKPFVKDAQLKTLMDPAWCGLMKRPTDPTKCPFDEIALGLKGKDAVIMVNDILYYADQKKQEIHEIMVTEDNRGVIEQLKLRFTNKYQLADNYGLNLITSITGRRHPELTPEAFRTYHSAFLSVLSEKKHGDIIKKVTSFGAIFEIAKHVALHSSQAQHLCQYYASKQKVMTEANDAFDEFVRVLRTAVGENAIEPSLGNLSIPIKSQLKACYLKIQPWFMDALSQVKSLDALDKKIIHGLNVSYKIDLLECCCAKTMSNQPDHADKARVVSLNTILIIHLGDNYEIGFCNQNGEYEQRLITDNSTIDFLKTYKIGGNITLPSHLDSINTILTSFGACNLLTTRTKLAENTLYIIKTGYVFEYTVIDPFGRTKTGIISKEDLKKHRFKAPLTVSQLDTALPDLLAVIFKNGHTRPDPGKSHLNIPEFIKLGKHFKHKIKLASNFVNEKVNYFERYAHDTYTAEIQARKSSLNLPLEARAFHVIKDPYYSKMFKAMSDSLYKDVRLFCNESIMTNLVRQTNGIPFPDMDYPETHNMDLLLGSSKQLANFKRLFNVIYNLEKAFEELETLQDDSFRPVYVYHLIKAYLEVQTLWGLSQDLIADPQLCFLSQSLTHQYRHIQHYFGDLFAPYSASRPVDGPQTPGDEGINSLWYTLHGFVLIPNDVKAKKNNQELSPLQLNEIRVRTKKLVIAIERVINRSDSYFKLFFETPAIYCLFKELKGQLAFFMDEIYKAGLDEQIGLLEKLDKQYFSELLLAADRYEMILGLKPGLLSGPLQEILDEFYKGLLEPLGLHSERHLACLTPDLIGKPDIVHVNIHRGGVSRLQQRINQVNAQSVEANNRQLENSKKLEKLTHLLKAIEAYQIINLQWWFSTANKQMALKPASDLIRAGYELASPILQAENKSRCCSITLSELPVDDVSKIPLSGFDAGYLRVVNDSKSINSLFYVNKRTGTRTELGRSCSIFVSDVPDIDVSKVELGDFVSSYIRVINKNPVLNCLFYVNKITGMRLDLKIDDENLEIYDSKIARAEAANVLSREDLTFLTSFVQGLRCCSMVMSEMPVSDVLKISLDDFVSGYIRVINKKTGFNSLIYVNKITGACINLDIDEETLKKYDLTINGTDTATILLPEKLMFIASLPNQPAFNITQDNLKEYDLKILASATYDVLSTESLAAIQDLTGHVHDMRHDRAHADNVYTDVDQFVLPVGPPLLDNLKNTCNYYHRMVEGYKLEVASAYNRMVYLQQLVQTQTVLHKKIKHDYIESSFEKILTKMVLQCLEVPELKQEYSKKLEAHLRGVKKAVFKGCLAKIIVSLPVDADKVRVCSLNEILIIHIPEGYQIGFCNQQGAYEQKAIADVKIIKSLSVYKSPQYIENSGHKNEINQMLTLHGSSYLCKSITSSHDIHQTIQKALAGQMAQFEAKSLAPYRQLNEILTALGRFNAYATAQSQKFNPLLETSDSLFEDKITLAKKTEWVAVLKMIATDTLRQPEQRLKDLHDEINKLRSTTFKDDMLAYRRFDGISFAWLHQCVISVLTALHLYTPEPVKCYHQINKAVSGSLRFFKSEQSSPIGMEHDRPVMAVI